MSEYNQDYDDCYYDDGRFADDYSDGYEDDDPTYDELDLEGRYYNHGSRRDYNNRRGIETGDGWQYTNRRKDYGFEFEKKPHKEEQLHRQDETSRAYRNIAIVALVTVIIFIIALVIVC